MIISFLFVKKCINIVNLFPIFYQTSYFKKFHSTCEINIPYLPSLKKIDSETIVFPKRKGTTKRIKSTFKDEFKIKK